ncbi:MAG TPA: type II toxin-antitoxin system Phd/YefM family antitoxin [Usitatibacter sp.]|nr:type II toxin-antitoxin system Phd/YefM family antitoxin [Usitatibacter sp.]
MAAVRKFRTARGEMRSLEAVPASRLKNAPGAIVDQAAAGRPVVITRHDTPRVVILSFDDFEELARAREPELGALEARFDELLAGMQKPAAKRAVRAALDATSEELGRAAVAAVRKPRKARRAG